MSDLSAAGASTKTPNRSANETRSAIVRAPSLSKMRCRCALIVRSVMPSAWAVCLLILPRTTNSKTSRSRGVNVSSRERASPHPFLSRVLRFVVGERALDAVDQRLLGNRLCQHVLRACPHGPHGHRHVSVPREKTIGNRDPSSASRACGSSPLSPGRLTSSKTQPA